MNAGLRTEPSPRQGDGMGEQPLGMSLYLALVLLVGAIAVLVETLIHLSGVALPSSTEGKWRTPQCSTGVTSVVLSVDAVPVARGRWGPEERQDKILN